MTERINENMKFTNSVERNKAASQFCLRHFPSWFGSKEPEKQKVQGELQRITVKAWQVNASEQHIVAITEWWLWFRTLIIENTFSKPQKEKLIDLAISAAIGKQKLHLVSTRSPELLHSLVGGKGDSNLSRSRLALRKMTELSTKSNQFIPTKATVFLADRAITNVEEIAKLCDVTEELNENERRLKQICTESGSNITISRLSKLQTPFGPLSSLVNLDGSQNSIIPLTDKARRQIDISGRESIEFHQSSFGWSEEKSRQHNFDLGITMGLVGQAINQLEQPGVIIHNESFISRGQLNNLLNSVNDPVPVICLTDLLETKRVKD